MGGYLISMNDDVCVMFMICMLYMIDMIGLRSVCFCVFVCSIDECSYMFFLIGDGVGVYIFLCNMCVSYYVCIGCLGVVVVFCVFGGL